MPVDAPSALRRSDSTICPLPRTDLSIHQRFPQVRMSTRRRAREIVLQLLYEADMNDSRDAEGRRKFIRSRMQGRKALTDFSFALLQGTLQEQAAIDELLSKLATNWKLSRMSVVDRNILRLGAYEILYAETPGRVAVNESIVLAKRYGDKNSPRFVNGVLDRLLKDSEQT
jgi:transcription antitermination protein NusB